MSCPPHHGNVSFQGFTLHVMTELRNRRGGECRCWSHSHLFLFVKQIMKFYSHVCLLQKINSKAVFFKNTTKHHFIFSTRGRYNTAKMREDDCAVPHPYEMQFFKVDYLSNIFFTNAKWP